MNNCSNDCKVNKEAIPPIQYPDMRKVKTLILEERATIDPLSTPDQESAENISCEYFINTPSHPPLEAPIERLEDPTGGVITGLPTRGEVDVPLESEIVSVIPKPEDSVPKTENRGRRTKPVYHVQKVVAETEDTYKVVSVGNFSSIQKIADLFGTSYSKMYRTFKRTDKLCRKIIITKIAKDKKK